MQVSLGPYLQIKGVNKEAVVAAGSMLKLDGSYTIVTLDFGLIVLKQKLYLFCVVWIMDFDLNFKLFDYLSLN